MLGQRRDREFFGHLKEEISSHSQYLSIDTLATALHEYSTGATPNASPQRSVA